MKANPFRSFGLSEPLLRGIDELKFQNLTEIQFQSLPQSLAGRDLIAQAKTGSGKTAAFVITVLQKIELSSFKTQGLILCPTRELCDQIFKETLQFSKYFSHFRVVCLIGGRPLGPQEQELALGAQLILGTPGRTLEHLKNGKWSVSDLKVMVLDEADRLLEDSFQEEIEAIFRYLPIERQTLFFSATFSESMDKFSLLYQKNPYRIKVEDPPQAKYLVQQFVYPAEKPQKANALIKILRAHPFQCALIFCRTKATVEEIGKLLYRMKVKTSVLHADLSQADRDQTARLFRNGSLRVLVATDIAARGLDIESLDLVINFDLPSSIDTYIHRIGRTGRAGRLGTAVAIATEYENDLILQIENATGQPMARNSLSAIVSDENSNLQETLTRTLQISVGRSQKVTPEEIRKLLTSGSQALEPTDIGRIEVQDRMSFVAISSLRAERALHKLRNSQTRGLRMELKIF